MYNTYCLLCHEPNRFKNEVYSLQNKRIYIQNKYGIDNRQPLTKDRLYMRLLNAFTSFSCQCGSCLKINNQELLFEQEQICKTLYFFIQKYGNDKSAKCIVKNLFCGDYPQIYNIIK